MQALAEIFWDRGATAHKANFCREFYGKTSNEGEL